MVYIFLVSNGECVLCSATTFGREAIRYVRRMYAKNAQHVIVKGCVALPTKRFPLLINLLPLLVNHPFILSFAT